MNAREMAAIFEILKGSYPHSFKQIDNPKLTLNLWCTMFETETALEVAEAVKIYITTDTSGFMPSIGMIKKIIAQNRISNELTEDDAWTRICEAASNGLYNAEEEFNKLPDTLKSFVGGPSRLRDWAMMDIETFNSVVESNFRKSYKATIKRKEELLMIPPSVRQALVFLDKPDETSL